MPKEEKKENARRGAQNGRQARERSHPSPVDRNAVPVLKHGADNNYPTFKKKIAMAALEKFGDLGRMIELNAYWEPTAPNPADYDLDNDPHGLNLSDIREARKEYGRKVARMKGDRAAMFAFILLQLSNESIDAIKLEEGWDESNEEKDPLSLWRLIEGTHRVGIASRIPTVLKSESRCAYKACAQSAFESIVKFKERFDDLLANYYNEHENPEMDDADIAMDFYGALDNSRYASFKTNLLNGINSGAVEQPATLNDMYTQAANFLVAARSTPVGGNRAAFATTSDRANNQAGGKGGKGGRGGGRGGGGDDKGRSGGGGRGGKAKSGDSAVECWGCGTAGHMLRDCPEVNTDDQKESKSGSVKVTIRRSHTCSAVAYATGEPTTQWWEVLLDNQANTSLIHPRLLRNIRRISDPAVVGGITGDSVTIDLVGELVGFDDVLCDHSAAANVLCQADVERRTRIQ